MVLIMEYYLLHFDEIIISEGDIGEMIEEIKNVYFFSRFRSLAYANKYGKVLAEKMKNHEFIKAELVKVE